MMEIAEEVASDVRISYKGRPVPNLLRFQFILDNTGFAPLEATDIVAPITWRGSGNIIAARVLVTEPPVQLRLEIQGDSLAILWQLFNQGCRAVIEIICEGKMVAGVGEVSGQVRGISRIQEKRIWWRDPDEMIREMDASLVKVSPRIRAMNRLIGAKWIIRHRALIMSLYSLFLAVLFPYMFLDIYGSPPFVRGAALFASVSIVLAIQLWFRNPYGSILRKAKRPTARALDELQMGG